MSKPHALVVGASIAGPITAYWLARAGFRITVIERFPKFRKGGQNIDIRTSGVTVMRKIPGMEAAVRAKTTTQDAIQFVNAQGNQYEIFRDGLSEIICDLTKDNPNVEYVFGEQVSEMHQEVEDEESKVTVKFKEGKLPATEYDLVVACDGATSRTRAIGFDCDVRTHIHPINMWAAYASIEKDLLNGSKTGTMYTAVGGRALAIGPDLSGGNRGCALAVLPQNDPSATLPFRTAQKSGDAALRAHVREHFANTNFHLTDLVPAITSAPDFYASEIVQVKLPSLSRGAFTLTGDAAHAPGPTGCGTTLALISSYLLAGELLSHLQPPSSSPLSRGRAIRAALRSYASLITPIATSMQKLPPGIPGVIAPQTRWGLWVRDAVLMAAAWGQGVGGKVLGRWAPSFGGDGSELPEYAWVE
ncbi:FAD/NAD(P)-binding domain-containing protein [Bimuria novae-zelandiae CBS 107.79]|uniref:FAD/NAD(P)-binding domain-containing protein n=1 Tax=Bimuria novae-zelandiae CBS 107.79 TaxID=1447943 RepID=A0A6A5VB79_9PLEO|nr:FAD/NAD(P)-binding domain-containing protein [Bimuria novae-zelandiae CBS 107.79]